MRSSFALGLLAALTLAPLALPTSSAECTWNDDFTDPAEETGLVAFHDGPVCTVTPFPCPEDPRYSCAPW
jgi:hypothetical protein